MILILLTKFVRLTYLVYYIGLFILGLFSLWLFILVIHVGYYLGVSPTLLPEWSTLFYFSF